MTQRTPTQILIEAMLALSRDIHSGDGVANAAIFEAAQRLSELHSMVGRTHHIVQAQHGAEHMLDGFRLKRRTAIDDLLAQFEREMAK